MRILFTKCSLQSKINEFNCINITEKDCMKSPILMFYRNLDIPNNLFMTNCEKTQGCNKRLFFIIFLLLFSIKNNPHRRLAEIYNSEFFSKYWWDK